MAARRSGDRAILRSATARRTGNAAGVDPRSRRCSQSLLASLPIAFAAGPLDEAQRAGRTEATFPQASEDYLPRHGQRRRADAGRGQGPQHVARLDRRRRPLLGPGDARTASRPSISSRSSPPIRARPIATASAATATRAGAGSARSTSPASRSRPAPIRSGSASGSTCAAPNCPPDPFEDETKYPGVKIGARGTTFKDGSTLPVGSYFGDATGIVGLRLFPNPDFDQAAKDKWDPERYYTDPNYYNDPKLVRPYRVGMACGFCHVGPSPIHPPADPAHPQWADLNSTVGAQYLWMDRVFVWSRGCKELPLPARAFLPAGHDGHLARLDRLHQQSAHNERGLSARAPARGGEALGQGDAEGSCSSSTSSFPASSTSPTRPGRRACSRTASDSVGVFGALNRVYINIGLYSEEWMRHFNPFFGGKPIDPDPDRDRGGELRLLARDRGRHAVHG